MSNPTRKSNAGTTRDTAVQRKRPRKTTPAQRAAKARQTGIIVQELKPINRNIPYKRTFLDLSASTHNVSMQEQGFFKKVRGLFDGARSGKGLSKEEVIRLRQSIGDLKSGLDTTELDEEGGSPAEAGSSRPKTKKELLEEKRKSLGEQSKSEKKKTESRCRDAD